MAIVKKSLLCAAAFALIAASAAAQEGYGGVSFGRFETATPNVGTSAGDRGAQSDQAYEFGGWSLGSESQFASFAEQPGIVRAGTSRLRQIRLRAGREFASLLGYVVIGGSPDGGTANRDGVWGLGLGFAETDRVSVVGELLRREYGSDRTGSDPTLYNLRISFRF